MAFYYLLLGHLFGDFVLQTDKIAQNKGKYWRWNVLHVIVVTLCTFVFSIPFGAFMSVLVLFNGALHFVLDHYKADLAKIFRLPGLASFLIDQFLHIILLYIVSLFAMPQAGVLLNPAVLKLLLLIVFITSFSAVFNQFVLSTIFPRTNSRFFEEGEKQEGIVTRLLITSSLYLSYDVSSLFLLLLLAAAAAFTFQFKLRRNASMNLKQLTVKLLLDFIVSAAGIFFIIFL